MKLKLLIPLVRIQLPFQTDAVAGHCEGENPKSEADKHETFG